MPGFPWSTEAKRFAPGRQVVTREVDGRVRRFTIQMPSGAGDQPLPVVVVLHGAGASGSHYLDKNGWAEKADREKFLVVAPDGLPAAPDLPMSFDKNPRVWNTGQLRPDSLRARIDDVAFIERMLDEIAERASIDLERVYLAGHSNGAGMAFRLATERSDRFAALSAVASHCWIREPQPTRPMPTLYIVGTDDPIVPLAGGEVVMPWGGTQTKPAVAITLVTWAQALRCHPEPMTLSKHDGVRIDYYRPHPGGAPLTAYYLECHGHGWPGGSGEDLPARFLGPSNPHIRATDVIWGFFRRQSRIAPAA
jgi:polyhydroxybutyrate depolymerase